jgi:hypothetical protein
VFRILNSGAALEVAIASATLGAKSGPGESIAIQFSPDSATIASGESAAFTAKTAAARPDPGKYAGVIFVGKKADKSAATAPLNIVLTVTAPELLITKSNITLWREIWRLWRSESVPLPVRNLEADAKSGVRIVGAVRSDGGGWAQVKWHPAEQGQNAGLTIDAPPGAGTYTGDVTIFDPSKALTLTVYTKDIAVWPILVILTGILLAYRAKRYTSVLRVTLGLRIKEAELGQMFRHAQDLYDDAAHGKTFATYDIAADLGTQRHIVLNNLAKVERSPGTTLDDQNAPYKLAVDTLTATQNALALWPTFAKSLTDLQAAVDAAVANPPANPVWPGLHAAANTLLQGAAIPIANVSPLNTQVTSLTPQINALLGAPVALAAMATTLADAVQTHLEDNDPRRVRILEQRMGRYDVYVTIFAAVIATFSGLNQFYLGNKSFGTFADYATVFLWAVATKATLDMISAVVDKLVPITTKM